MAEVTAARNFWRDDKCAKAFWSQQELPPYRELLAATIALAAPQAGEKWLDLGCGGGRLTQAIWEETRGTVAAVTGLDVAAVNAEAYRRLRSKLSPPPGDRIGFLCQDFSSGLPMLPAGGFDGVVSGLSITYAESSANGRWTEDAYDHVLSEVFRILRPGGRFIFSANLPNPSWLRVAIASLPGIGASRRPLQFLKHSQRMMRYGAWLKREARSGRFHYLPHTVVEQKLSRLGFRAIEHRLAYAEQAYVFRALKPV